MQKSLYLIFLIFLKAFNGARRWQNKLVIIVTLYGVVSPLRSWLSFWRPRSITKSVGLTTPLKEKNDSNYYNQDCHNSYYVVNYLVLLVLFAQLIASRKFAVLGLTLAIVVAVIANCFVTLTY